MCNIAGIDIASMKFDYRIINGNGESLSKGSCEMSYEGFQSFLSDVPEDTVFIMESTGRYHKNLCHFLIGKGFSVCVENPMMIKSYVKSTTLRKTKTDSADALSIARYGLANYDRLHRENRTMDDEVRSIARRRQEVAEDIVQTVFISLWTNKRGKPFEGSLRSYLFGAVSKAALCWVRDHGKVYFEDIESHIDDFWDDVFSQEDAEQEERLRKKLHAAVDALPEKPRLVLQAIVWQEKPYKQVAAEMGISVNTVKTYYARALQALRKSLGSNPLLLLVWLKKQKSKLHS